MQPYGGGAGGGMQHQVMDCAKAFVGTYCPSSMELSYSISRHCQNDSDM